jgi:hypothetical protein
MNPRGTGRHAGASRAIGVAGSEIRRDCAGLDPSRLSRGFGDEGRVRARRAGRAGWRGP